MRILVTGGLRNPVLLDTTEATALIITNDDGQPNTIFRITDDGKGWIRRTEHEDKDFYEVAKDLGLM